MLLQRGPVDPKFQVEGVAPTNHFSSQKTRLNYLSYGIKISTDLSSVLSQYTRVTDGRTDGRTDGQTDRILIAIPRLHCMQRGKNENNTCTNRCFLVPSTIPTVTTTTITTVATTTSDARTIIVLSAAYTYSQRDITPMTETDCAS